MSALNRFGFMMAAAAMAIFFAGCPVQPGFEPSPSPSSSPIPTGTVQFVRQDDGSVLFKTNEDRFLGVSGTTIWRYGEYSQTTMSDFTVEATKASGSASMGFGMVYCVQEDGQNFYTTLINTEGYYTFLKVVDGSNWTFLTEGGGWKFSSALAQGYSMKNVLKMSYDSDTSTFSLEANGTAVGSFTDTFFTGGCLGFIAVVSGTEAFPDVPVSCRFKETSPANIYLPTP